MCIATLRENTGLIMTQTMEKKILNNKTASFFSKIPECGLKRSDVLPAISQYIRKFIQQKIQFSGSFLSMNFH